MFLLLVGLGWFQFCDTFARKFKGLQSRVLVMVVDSTNTHKGSLLSGLVPVLNPGTGTDACRVLSVDLALFVRVLSALLHADNPLIVSVPAVEGLVL